MPVGLRNKRLLVEQIETLPPLATIAGRILAVTDSPRTSATDVARVLCEDQAIAAKVLRVANSPFYGVASKITEVSRAVVILGTVAVRNLVIGLCARDTLLSSGTNSEHHQALWRHSVAVAAAGDLIASRVSYDPPEEALLAGLLHDIGQLAMVTFQPEAFQAVIDAQTGEQPVLEREVAHLGLSHVEAGDQILTNWKLPPVLCRIARSHHDGKIHKGGAHARLLTIVMLADILAHTLGVSLDGQAIDVRFTPLLLDALHMKDADLCDILGRLERRIAETADVFAIRAELSEDSARTAAREVIWVTDDHTPPYAIGTPLLQHLGYTVQRATLDSLGDVLQPGALILVDLPQQAQTAHNLAQGLVERGYGQTVLLAEPLPGAPRRMRDETTGLCRVPPTFTTFDLRWFEEQSAT